MKKILSFLFLLFIPFMVKAADVEIKSITEIKKVGDVVVNHEPTYKGLKINFDLAFTNVDDAVTYKVVVKNNTNEDLEVEEDPQYGTNKYIKYEAEFPSGTNIIKAGETAEINLTASYDKEIPTQEFDNGVYNERGTVAISFIGAKENPLTSTLPIAIIAIAAVAVITIVLAKHGMKKTALTLVLVSILSVPIVSLATRKISFDVESKIYIKDRCYRLDTEFGSFEEGKDVKEICVDFSENKYVMEEFYFMVSSERRFDTDKLVLEVIRQHFNDDSYVRVYDSEDKLLLEVTKADFPKPVFRVEYAIYYTFSRITKTIGDYNKEDVRVEKSADLQEYNMYDTAYLGYSADPKINKISGPWITNQSSINKIEYLESQGTIEYGLLGFNQDSKDTHLYHAIWGEKTK